MDAPCGRVANVIVRNYGAIGRLPYHRFAGFGGTECFPLVVGGDDIGQIPPAGQRRPWVIEDVEIHGFHGDYHGYTTALMAHSRVTAATPSWAVADPNRRIVTVQRVQIRHDGLGTRTHGEVIGFGNAANGNAFESGRTTFADNALLNTAIGYNGDTGELRHVDLTNNVLLNIYAYPKRVLDRGRHLIERKQPVRGLAGKQFWEQPQRRLLAQPLGITRIADRCLSDPWIRCQLAPVRSRRHQRFRMDHRQWNQGR